MQIYLNIFKKSKIINYKDNIFFSHLNTSLVFHFFVYLILQSFFFNSNKLTKLLIVSLMRRTLVTTLLSSYLPKDFFLLYFFGIKPPYQIINSWTQPKKIVYPVLKSPFIYKKSFRHFTYTNYNQQIYYAGTFNYLRPVLHITPIKFELLNTLKSIKIKETQKFVIY